MKQEIIELTEKVDTLEILLIITFGIVMIMFGSWFYDVTH